jgi:proline iminopeptidase
VSHLRVPLLAVLAACGSAGSPGAAARSETGAEALARAGDHHIDLDGHRLAFHVAGRGPTCLVHSGGPGVEWTYLRMPDVERIATLVYVEPVGTGDSGRLASPNEYSYARYAADVESLRERLGLGRICLIGHSHGGLVALTYAVRHSDRLFALVLYGTSAALDAEWSRDVRANLVGWFGDRPWLDDARGGLAAFYGAETDEDAASAFRRWAPLLFASWDTVDPAIRESVEHLRVWAGPARYRGPAFDVTARLGDIHAPTLIVTGARDYAMSPAAAERMHAGIAGSRVAIVEHAGHMAHLEDPREFARVLQQFLEQADVVP